MGVPAEWLQGAVRFSLSHLNNEDEVRFVNQKVPMIVQRLRGLSALGKLANQQQVKADANRATDNIAARG
jgi:hypothetical protein